MKPATRLFLKDYAFTVAAWVLLTYFYFFTAYWGWTDLLRDGVLREYAHSGAVHLEIILSGIFFGSSLAFVNYVTEKTALRRRSFGQIILVKSVLYVLAMGVVAAAVYTVFRIFAVMPEQNLAALQEAMTPRYLATVGVYLLASIVSINFLLEVRRKFGPGNLLRLLTGRYHNPRVEHRIFLFLDLQGSTTIAEHLGHVRYSQFIRRCFHHLTDVVVRYDAEVYQYVGDEVVLSWRAERGLKEGRCIALYFAFCDRLARKRADYERVFGVMPHFRGGVDAGPVTVAEVGDIKREIAYHGDVLNTAARLQELGKTYGKSLLVSERVVEAVTLPPGLVAQREGEVALRGKADALGVYSVVRERVPVSVSRTAYVEKEKTA